MLFNLYLNFDFVNYTNITLKNALILLTDYFAQYGDTDQFDLTDATTGQLITLDTYFTQNNNKIKFSDLFDLLPIGEQISNNITLE